MEKTEKSKDSSYELDKSGPYPKDDLVGRTFGRLTILEWVGKDKYKKNRWLCECSCGAKKVISQTNLKSGDIKSCGCLYLELQTNHKYSAYIRERHPLYRKFESMKRRCYSKKHKYYKHYGDRGITVCDEWLNSSEAFMDWGLKNGFEEGLTLERIDNNKGYSPDNCCFTDWYGQHNNQRSNRLLTYRGRTQTIAQWAREIGIKYMLLYRRIYRGWSVEDALFKPLHTRVM